MQAPGLNPDTVKYIRHNIEAAMLNVDICHDTINTCAISSSSITHNQCQTLLLQLQAAKNILMSVDTSMGHHLIEQFLANEEKYIKENR